MSGTVRRVLVAIGVVALGAATPTATAAAPPGADMTGAGRAPSGVGLGSEAALAQDACNQANGRTNFDYEGTGPFCVNPWPEDKDNGGATAPGVTATTVKVIVRIPNAEMAAQAASTGVVQPKNQATGEPVTPDKVYEDVNALYDYATRTFGTYQLWGRTPQFEYMTASGSDETAQRADAVDVIAQKPFIVVDVTSGEVFTTMVAAEKIIVFGGGDNQAAAKQQPYRWMLASDPDAGPYLVASFAGSSLAGKKATWAGDDEMRSQVRAFGAVYPTSGFDLDVFTAEMKKATGKAPVEALSYDSSDATKAPEAVPGLVTRLKSAGVTTVVLFTTAAVTRSLMEAATAQEYRPEWIITGFGYHDFDGYGRTNDQSQMAHAFGVGVLPPAYEGQPATTGLFQWYWGTTQGNYSPTGTVAVTPVYQAMHYAGPKLTAKNVQKGLFAAPALGGAAQDTTTFQTGFGRTVRLPYDEHGSPGSDRTLLWWNPDITGGTQAVRSIVGKGRFMYLDDGARYAYGEFPAKPKFFDESASAVEVPWSTTFPDGVVPPANPCTDCPVNGGSGLLRS